MSRALSVISRAYARPPLSWLVAAHEWLADLVFAPFRPLTRQHAARKEAQLRDLAVAVERAGLLEPASDLRRLADQWGQKAQGERR